jgi:Protein kinase domain
VQTAVRNIGSWTIIEKLGDGGNAVVYLATNAEHPEVALKVMKTTKTEREPYRRFVQEIDTLERLGDFPGVLQLIARHLPERPSATDPAWLAMPRATLITDALEGQRLEVVVEALRVVSDTLARLASEHGIGHRDIKPANLYHRDGEWLVGDFGLVAAPDLDELTRHGRPLGSLHFTADEMIRDPVNADPHRADVFSLGKTLWVLATGQRFPPDGHQVAGTRGLSIADLRPHPHAAALDRLVDRMTMVHPAKRPSLEDVTADLDAWTDLAAEPVQVDVTAVRQRLRQKMERRLAEEDVQETWRDQAQAVVRELQELTRPLNQALKDVHPRAEIDVMAEQYVQKVLTGFERAEDPLFRWHRQSQILVGHRHGPWVIRFGRLLQLSDEGEISVRLLIDVGFTTVMGGPNFNWTSGSRSAPVGSVQFDAVLQQAIADAAEQLPLALEVFVEHLSDESS